MSSSTTLVQCVLLLLVVLTVTTEAANPPQYQFVFHIHGPDWTSQNSYGFSLYTLNHCWMSDCGGQNTYNDTYNTVKLVQTLINDPSNWKVETIRSPWGATYTYVVMTDETKRCVGAMQQYTVGQAPGLESIMSKYVGTGSQYGAAPIICENSVNGTYTCPTGEEPKLKCLPGYEGDVCNQCAEGYVQDAMGLQCVPRALKSNTKK